MQARKHDWFNIATLKPAYSIEARHSPADRWRHMIAGGKPTTFATARERDALLAELSNRFEIIEP